MKLKLDCRKCFATNKVKVKIGEIRELNGTVVKCNKCDTEFKIKLNVVRNTKRK